MDTAQMQKIYVAVGNDVQDGFKTLDWALKKWKSHPISIVILHVTFNSKEYVYTPFGKLPATSVSDEKLQVQRNYEQEKMNKLLSKYVAFCGKVPAEIFEVEKFDEPIQRRIIDLILGLQITKLVMGFSVMKPSWKSRGALSGLFYVYQRKPEFCQLFIICGGKQVFLGGKNDEKIMEDENGVMVSKMRDKTTFKDWLERMFTEKISDTPERCSGGSSTSSANLESPDTQNQWEFHLQEIENYFQELLSSNIKEGSCGQDNDVLQISPTELDVTEQKDSNMSAAEKVVILKSKFNEARKRKEAKDNVERHAKAEWAICLCNSRAEELESNLKEEVITREELKKELDAEKERNHELRCHVEENKRRLSSLAELQSELSNKLGITTLAKSRAEIQLEKAAAARTEILMEIEELRRQRDVLNRRIEFCKEKDAIGMAARLTETGCSFREYTAEEIRLATDNFSERLRLKSGGGWTNVHRGRINHFTVAIKMLNSGQGLSQDFQAKVKYLSDIRHPHLVAMVGFCPELQCIVLEYMHNGCLRDMLLSRRKNGALRWHDRIRIATEVCSGLGFLHSVQPSPFLHCHFNPSNILLDRNLVAKITLFGLNECHYNCNTESDIQALGLLLLHLLTGRNWVGLAEQALMMDKEILIRGLDEVAGQWPLDLVKKLVGLAVRCISRNNELNEELGIGKVMEELNEIRRKADDLAIREGQRAWICRSVNKENSNDVPSVFVCPILQEVMKNPHVAADGFSYEQEAIEKWLQSGHNTSPMTNLRLKHTFLTPNYTLRSLIEDWQSKRSAEAAT